LNELSKEKIRQACFIKSQGLCLITSSKVIYVADLKDRAKLVTFKTNIQNISELHGGVNVKDRVELYVTTSDEVHVL
jgi:hypothetical protein